MISKELLSEVMLTVDEITFVDKGVADYIVWQGVLDEGNFCEGTICIYTLAHKCKEWAYNYGYNIFIEKHSISIYEAHIKCSRFNMIKDYGKFVDYYPREDSATEAIFKACEWILENKDK